MIFGSSPFAVVRFVLLARRSSNAAPPKATQSRHFAFYPGSGSPENRLLRFLFRGRFDPPGGRGYHGAMTGPGLTILLAAPRGFCAGVDRAIEIVERALAIFGAPIYVKHEIVHNRHVVNRLRLKGVVFVEELAEIPDDSVAIFSAHGVSKATRDEAAGRRLRIIDATCPLVTKVHLEVHRLHREGCQIVLIGHAGHVEVAGTMGQLPPGAIRLVGNAEQVRGLDIPSTARVAYVTQTTLSVDDTRAVVEALRERFPGLQGPQRDDICYATQNRQNAVKALVGRVEMLLVIGSKNSSNSNRLAEVARSHGVRAYLVDGPEEIRPEWIEGVAVMGLTAGASAPEEVVRETILHLTSRYGGRVELLSAGEERVEFSLPRELLALEKG